METLRAMQMFVSTVEEGSFAGAGRRLEISASAVSKQVANLEDELGVRLLQRSTRSLSLTPEGELYHAECRRILAAVEDAREGLSALSEQPRGKLRVTAPAVLGQTRLGAVLQEYRHRFPEVDVELYLTDAVVDIVYDAYDVAIRVGSLDDSSLIGRRLADNKYIVCAAPAYLERHGAPESPAALLEHNCLTSVKYEPLKKWRFQTDQGEQFFEVSGSLSTNNTLVMRQAVLDGEGIALLPYYMVDDELAGGRLVSLFDGQVPANGGIWALYPSRRLLPFRVETFLELLGDHFDSAC